MKAMPLDDQPALVMKVAKTNLADRRVLAVVGTVTKTIAGEMNDMQRAVIETLGRTFP